MALSTYAANGLLDALFNNTAFQISAAYWSLHTGDPGSTGANEHSGDGYGTRPAMEFDAVASQASQNTNAEVQPTATGDWSQSTYAGLFDAATGGNFLLGAQLTTAKTVLSGEQARMAIGEFDVSLTGMDEFGTTTLDNMLKALLNNTALQITQAYLSLHSASPGQTGANELSGNGYARLAASFGAAAAKAISNDTELLFAEATTSDWTAASHWGLWSALTDGTYLVGGALTASRTIGVGKQFRVAIGDIDISIS